METFVLMSYAGPQQSLTPFPNTNADSSPSSFKIKGFQTLSSVSSSV